MVAALAALYHENYVSAQWQIYLIYVAIIILCTAIVALLPRAIPALEKGLFFGSLAAFTVFFITVLATSKNKSSASRVFADWNNQTGWNDGFGFILACGTAMYVFIGTDGVIHLAEVRFPHL
jgi:choline transport protein